MDTIDTIEKRMQEALQRSEPKYLSADYVRTCCHILGRYARILFMTLLLAMANDSYSMVLGDRRLVCNGSVSEDESNKVCVLFCDDARIAIAYTGLALCLRFRTQDWLRDTLSEIGKKSHTLEEMLAKLQSQADDVFSQPPIARLPAATRRLAFLISGFKYTANGSEHICYLLSNVDPDDPASVAGKSFKFYQLGEPGKVIVEAAGYKTVLTDRDYVELRAPLEANAPAPRVLHKAVEIVQRVSKEAATRRMIGSQCNSAVVPRMVDTNITNTYHSARAVSQVYGPDIVVAVTDCGGCATGMLMGTEGMILAGPNIRKNQECWCGSGEKFGKCHLKKFGSTYARVPGFRKPMAMTFAMWKKKKSELSGQMYCVQSAFA